MGEMMEPRYGRASVNGLELAWAEWGSGTVPADRTIVGIHGITANLHTWDALAPGLTAAGYRIIGYDLRGRGDSQKPARGYNLAHHSDDLLALLDYFRLPQANIVGHSLGALIGMYFAANYPERVRRLVLVDHGYNTPPDARDAIGISLGRLGKVFGSWDEYVNLFKTAPFYPRWTSYIELFNTYDAELRPDGTVVSRVLPAAIEEELANLGREEFLPVTLHPQIKSPTLILRAVEGTLDNGKRGFILTKEGADIAARNIAGARHVAVAGVNHYTITLDPPPQMTQELLGFLN